MSDNNKFPVSAEELGQAFVQPVVNEAKQVKDEVGQAIEMGNAANPYSNDPQAQAQKQQEDAKREQEDNKKKRFWQDFLQRFQNDEQRLKKMRSEEEQKRQQETEEAKQKTQIIQYEKQKKQKSFEQQHVEALEAKAERQKNVGG